ncbi:MAG: metal-binding protein [Ruminococcaceae bacterium]|nr:metal-binding protein [Oscillospiraceae bacterium]
MKECSKFFKNSKCEYFPCHKVNETENFNCLFCYCPLYSFGDDCGGNFTYTPDGIKDCSDCTIVHLPKGYDFVMEKLNSKTK